MGYVWALAFDKTRSIMLPLGLHLGWNFVHNTLFSKGPLGDMLWVAQGGQELEAWASLFSFLLPVVITTLILWVYLTYFVKDESEE